MEWDGGAKYDWFIINYPIIAQEDRAISKKLINFGKNTCYKQEYPLSFPSRYCSIMINNHIVACILLAD